MLMRKKRESKGHKALPGVPNQASDGTIIKYDSLFSL